MHPIVRTARELVTSYKWSSLAGGLAALAIMGTATVAAISGAPQQPAGRSADNIWQVTNQRPDGAVARDNVTGQVAVVQFNKAAFDAQLAVVARDTDPAAAGVLMSLPLPDGTFERFLVKDSPMLAPELAAAFPEIKTYSAQGVDDPTATARFGWTAAGFHAIVLSASRASTYIDVYAPSTLDTYLVYTKGALQKGETWQCLVEGTHNDAYHRSENAFPISNGTTLRTYRLALAATSEYTTAAGNTKELALARMTATMNRVNGIYERELAVRMTMATGTVGDPTALIFLASGPDDGYTNDDGGAMLDQNQTKLDLVIGTGNYDIGHVFSTGGGGVAYLRSPCSATLKAGGVTGSPNPTGDAFDVDYVAHEMGHQFGGNHTYNGSASSCSTRSAPDAYEVGSGSTIQAYAGICGVENLQRNSNDYFHVKSLDEMTAFITDATAGDSCGVDTATNNTPPTVEAGNNFTIPAQTPFVLNAVGSDSNGDSLTYTWEQFDLGTVSTNVATASTDDGSRPLFRSYSPSTSPTRYFPSATYILNNANTPPTTYVSNSVTYLTGETLPTTARTMTFQVTARDNRSGGGAIATDSMTVTTVVTGAAFAVTSQNSTPSPVAAGSPVTVTWNVAGTTEAPISAANVRIRLSTDGGQTFSTELASSTANDGTEQVTIPANALTTSQARIMVQAVGNIFFDVNDANFAITGGSSASVPEAPAKPTGTAANGSVNLSWVAPANGGSAITGYQVQQSTNANSGFANVASNICPINTTTTSCNITGLTNGTQYFFKVAAINGVGTGAFSPATDPLTPNGGGGGSAPSTPTAPTGTPGNGSVNLSWSAPANGGSPITGYQVQQSTSADSGFTNVATNVCPNNNTTTSCNVTGLTNGTPYYFKVAAINTHGTSAFSPASSGITPAAPCSYVLSPDRASVDRLVSNETITVTAGTGCAWTAAVATDSTSMLSISTGASGTGNGTVAYQVSANPGSTTRTGTMTVAGQTFTVTQNADSYTVEITVQQGTTPVAGAFVALIGTGAARAGAAMDVDFAADGTTRKFGAVSGATGIARFRGVVPGTFTMKAHSGGRSVTSGSITVSPSTLSATLSMTSSSSALTTLGAYGSQTGTIVADGQTGVFYLNTTAIPSLFRTTDHGGNWSPVTLSSDDPATGLDASTTAGSPTTSGRGGEIATIVGNKVWYSFDFGLTWASMNAPTGVGNAQMYWAHIADTASTVSQLFLTSTSTAAVYVADMTATTPSMAAMTASYKTNAGDLVAVGNGDTAPVLAVFDVVSGATKFWAVDATPASTDTSVSVSSLSPTLATNGTTVLAPGNVTLFKIGGPATGVEIGSPAVKAPNTVLLYSLTSAPASNARMATCTASSCTYPLGTTFKNYDDTTSTTSTFANPGVGEVSLCSANFGAVGSIAPTGGYGSVGQCWLTVNGTSLDVRGVPGINNNTGMAYDAAYDGTSNLVIISGDGQHGAAKSARMTAGAEFPNYGQNRPYFPGFPTIASAGSGATSGGIAVQGITSAVIRQSLYQPSSATNMASVMSFSGGGRTIGSTDGGTTWFTLVDRGGSRMDWWNGATSGSQWMVLGTGGAGNWMYGTQLAAASDFADTTTMSSVLNGSSSAVGPTDFSMSTSVITSPGVYGVKGITGTDYVGLGSYDGAKLRIDLARLTFSTPTVTMGSPIPLLEIAIPDPPMASDPETAAAATGTNAGSIRMAYCPATGSHASVADALFVAMAAVNTGDTGQLRKITGLGAAIAASSTPNFSSAISGAQSLTVPAGSNLRDIAVNCADGTVWLARSSQTGGGGGGTPVSGLLKSTDGGTTIAATVMPTSGNAVTALQNIVAVDFNKTTTTQVVAVSRQGDVLVSDDSAATWRLVNDTSQAACIGQTTQCGRGFGGEEPGSFAMPPASTGDAARDGMPTANATVVTSSGVLGSGAGLFSVALSTANSGPTITLTPTALRFAATKNGAAATDLTSVTSGQSVSVSFSSGAPVWTISSNVTWLSLSASGGTGSGTFTASVVNPSNVIGASTSLTGTITLTSADAANSPQTITVTLTVDQSNGATTVAPIGGFDSPTNGSTNVVGAIAVTGWALDDVGVERVEIWRNCLTPVDSTRPGVCRNATPTGASDRVFIGNAAFVPGARSDIESAPAYTSYPQTYRAGWGYLLLTNALPNQTTGATEGGQGTVTLYAYAIDREGRYTELGSKVITLNNDNATVPFGAIDTPEQGGTITGALTANFGWAMTRRQNAAGVDVPKCIERTRYRVFIDGVARTLTPGTNWFPNLSRADLTAAYPGLCDSANSLAAYYIDIPTLGLANGLHTIGWDVYDDNGTTGTQADDNVAGIGSRFFNILVGADAPSFDPLTAKPASRGAVADIIALPATESRSLRARVGAVEAPVVAVASDAGGRHAVNLPQGSRLTVDLGGAVDRGYLVVGDELRDLPIGSTLDGATGHFYWQPAIPYFGAFELVFVSATDRGGEARTTLDVSITDPTAGGEPEITITSPRAGANPNPVITVIGTARDPRSVSANGISAVHVWAYRKDVSGVPAQFLGDAVLTNGTYTMTTAPLQPGTYDIAVFAWVARTGTWAPAATVTIAVR